MGGHEPTIGRCKIGTRTHHVAGESPDMKTALHLIAILALSVLIGGCASRVGVGTENHPVGVGATVR